jgi:hypothetical protein
MATTHDTPATTSGPQASVSVAHDFREEKLLLLLRLSGPMEERLDDLVRRTGHSKAEIINLSIALFKAALDGVEEGKRVGIVDDDRELDTEFTGFHKNGSPVA